MIAIRHRTASGDPTRCWEYDGVRRVVILLMVFGSVEAEIVLPVAVAAHPRHGSWQIVRRDSHSWELTTTRFGSTKCHPIHDAIGGEHVLLMGATDEIALELSELEAS